MLKKSRILPVLPWADTIVIPERMGKMLRRGVPQPVGDGGDGQGRIRQEGSGGGHARVGLFLLKTLSVFFF